jgi:indolepyruvate ferredoxin oxidoreductase alpha subunit
VLIHSTPVQVDQQLCMAGRGCEDTPCYHKVGCPSVLLSLDDIRPQLSIDIATCVSCGLCAAACPFEAIRPLTVEQQPALSSVSLRDMLQD